MKKLFYILFIIIFSAPTVFCKSSDKFDVNSGSFLDFGKYVENVEKSEINAAPKDDITEEADDFENDAIINVTQRYQNDAVELKIDDIDIHALYVINAPRVFNLRINEAKYNIERNIRTENMIWDDSKAFSQDFFNENRRLTPIPSITNESYLEAKVSPTLSATIGQKYFYDVQGPSLLFIRENESKYNTGSIISYKGSGVNLSIGSYASSYNQGVSGGAILSTDALELPKRAGSVLFGGACFSSEAQNSSLATGGLFSEYSYRRLKLNAQIAQTDYSNSRTRGTSFYLTPELKLTNSLSLKTRLIRNMSLDSTQNEFVLSYKPKNNKNDLEFEINASKQYAQNELLKHRIKLTTSFRI